MKVKILSASVNPSCEYYDLGKIGKMKYDDAKKFFANDKIGACSVHEHDVNLSSENEFMFCADGADYGDGSDTMFNWLKVEND